MIIYKKIRKFIKEPVEIKCDICGNVYDIDDNIIETQEFLNIDFVGGYGSVFGDMNRVQCDICQHCLYDMISKYAIIKEQ